MSTIRRAGPGDSKRLSEFAEKTFRDTFGAMNKADDIECHCRESFSKSIQAAEIANPNMVTLLSEIGGDLAGFSQLRWAKAPLCVAASVPGEIQRLYVDAHYHGKGVASDLMNASLTEIRSRGSDIVWLGVWERNAKAIAFYKKFGFVEVGDHMFQLGGDPQRDIIMARPGVTFVDCESPQPNLHNSV